MILAGAPPAELDARPSPGEWSARENLAHLARHATVFLERLDRILREEAPRLGRYSAESDPEWPRWSTLPIDEVVRRLRDARRDLLKWTASLSPEQIGRRGVHPAFEAMTIPGWLEFFLLHEAHHLYVAMGRLAEARRRV